MPDVQNISTLPYISVHPHTCRQTETDMRADSPLITHSHTYGYIRMYNVYVHMPFFLVHGVSCNYLGFRDLELQRPYLGTGQNARLVIGLGWVRQNRFLR